MNHTVEIEFIKGNDNWVERRVFRFAHADIVPGKYIHIKSSHDGEFFFNLEGNNQGKLIWIGSEPSAPESQDEQLKQEVKDLINTDQIIGAIKHVRSRLGYGLKEAKDFVDKIRYIP